MVRTSFLRVAEARYFAPSLMVAALAVSCSAGTKPDDGTGGKSSGTGTATGQGGGVPACPRCEFNNYIECNGNTTDCAADGKVCATGLGCVACAPGENVCVGNEVHACGDDGNPGSTVVEVCDVSAGLTCSDGACKSGCQIAEDQPANIGCEFWAVDLDQQDGLNDPASAPWGVALSNTGDGQANVTIEMNEAPVGEAPQLTTVQQVSVGAGQLQAIVLPTRELDCGAMPNSYAAPGTCLSSRAYRITSSNPIVVYQFNVFENAYSNDASLLLPTNALGLQYRVLGWAAGHPVFIQGFNILDRSYVTVVGTKENTHVTVHPSWRIKGNPPIDATPINGTIEVTLNPFDVLNLETDDATLQDDPKTAADLSGSLVFADQPVAVFSGTETTSVPGAFDVPTYPGWDSMESGSSCCLDHLEDQMMPLESLGKTYVVARSPVRSTSGWREPDVVRFVGGAEPTIVSTNLPAPDDSFSLQPGEVKTTWTQNNFTARGDKPFLVGQLLVSQGRVDGPALGDPSLTVFPPVDQFRSEYVMLTPSSWTQNWVVIAAEVGSPVRIDGSTPSGCKVEPGGTVDGKTYESRVCALTDGAHAIQGDKPFGIVEYGYGNAGSYAVAGGADVKKIYVPPVPQ